MEYNMEKQIPCTLYRGALVYLAYSCTELNTLSKNNQSTGLSNPIWIPPNTTLPRWLGTDASQKWMCVLLWEASRHSMQQE